MTKRKNRERKCIADICTPTATYVVTRKGLRLPDGTTGDAAWTDLRDIGRKISLAPNPNEAISKYADRLRRAIGPYHPKAYVDGAAVSMLRTILDMYITSFPRNHKPDACQDETGDGSRQHAGLADTATHSSDPSHDDQVSLEAIADDLGMEREFAEDDEDFATRLHMHIDQLIRTHAEAILELMDMHDRFADLSLTHAKGPLQ